MGVLMEIAICDDQKEFCKMLKAEIEKFYVPEEVEIESFLSGEQFLEKYKSLPQVYQIIFMDIEMTGMNGLETAKAVHAINEKVPIIFLTSHTEFAMEGYEVSAFRFIAKPIECDKLVKALKDIEKLKHLEDRIQVYDGKREHIIGCSSIEYIQSENVYSSIVTDSGSYLIRKKLGDFEKKLPNQSFYKCHRSYIVNMGKVRTFDGKKIMMQNGAQLPISRGKALEFKTAMMKYIRTLG
jgi:DNA-binding LytR/AlgR family response regulator